MPRRMLALVVLAGWALPAGAQVRTDERVDVSRVLVDVRATDQRQAAAMDRLAAALEGYYLLSVESPVTTGGRHAIRVWAEARRATVSARRYYID